MQAILRRLPLLCLAMLALAAPAALAQDDDYDFSEIPVEEEEIPYIGVGGGYQLVVSLFDLEGLNGVARTFNVPEFSGPLFMHGGGGWTAIGIIPNMRVGVYGGGGSKEVTNDTSMGGVDYTRSLQFTAGYTVAHIDYAFTPFAKFTIAPGIFVGGGGTTVELTQTKKGGAEFASVFDPGTFGGAAAELNRQASISRSYIHTAGVLNFEYALTQFILLRLGAGYTMTFGDTWDDRHGTDIANVPEMKLDGLSFQAGIFLGLFQQ